MKVESMSKLRRGLGVAGLVLLLVLLGGLVYRIINTNQVMIALVEPPATAVEGARAALAAAGYAPTGQPVWATLSWSFQLPFGRAQDKSFDGTQDRAQGKTWQVPGQYRLFFVAPSPDGNADLYTADAYIGADGRVSRVSRVTRLTDTPAGDETAPVAAGRWLAFATRAADRYQSITCIPLADLSQRVVFAFDQPAERVKLAWQFASPGTTPVLTVVAGWPGREATLTVDPAGPSTGFEEAGLHYTPATAGEQAWLPNLVSRVRELPGVGPEKIAFVENVFFTVVDQVTRWLHGAPEAPAVASLPPESAAPPTAAPADVSEPVTQTPLASETQGPAGTAEGSRSASVTESPSRSADEPGINQTVEPTATLTLTPTLLPSRPPTSTATQLPTLTATPAGIRLADGIFRRASVRPDSQRPYAEVEIIEIDPGLVQIKMIPGTVEPRPTTGLIGSGVIPTEDWPDLVAAFNGGFAAMHGKFGMVVDRKVYLPPRDGIATLAVYEDGSLRMGTWGKDLSQTPDMVSYRQNCPPLIENGTITAETGKLTLWGLSVSNEVYLYRSGLGLTADGRLIYAVGKPLSAYTLARALQAAGAVYAMQLDVDEFHVAFITYDVKPGKPGQPPQVEGKKLRSDMRGFDGLFLRPFQLDFFYLVRRPQRLAQPIRLAVSSSPPPAQTTATAAASSPVAELPGQLAFASNRDGNWEIYTMQPGRSLDGSQGKPFVVTRRTEHPADDLYPAWSPDGKRLAFTSRRDGNAEIYILNLADGSLERVTRQPSEEWAPAWSPDGKRLAYQSDRNGQSDIYVSATDGSGEVRLTPYEGNHEAPDWSPDGRQIVFDSDLDVGEPVHASINVYFMNADGSNPRRFYSHGESPAWSPDGKTIAFAALRDGRWQILLLNTDGSGLRQLPTGRNDARYPAWSPDGRWLAFAGNEEGHWEIYAAPVAGGQPIRLTFGTADNSYPVWGK